MPILSAQDKTFFDENGYVVVPNVVPAKNRQAVVDAIFEFLNMDPHNPEDWYREPHRPNGMIEIYQHQALWDNRQHPKIYEAFCDIYGTDKLWVSEDRACMKPPQHPAYPEYDHKGFTHWDIDTSKLPQPFRVQGVLCLTDTDADMGGFQCVPGFHRNLQEWIAKQPADRHAYNTDLNALPPGMKVTPIPAKAGDLIIWTTLLAHGNGHNVSNKPRLCQYITMFPVSDPVDETARQARIHRWQNRLGPEYKRAFPGDPRRKEELQGKTAELTALGRKLLGIDAW